MEFILTILSASSQGLIWGVMVLGLYITFRILDFADLTVDGSLALGGSVSAILISSGFNPFVSLIIATIAGAIAGCVTGFLNVKLKIPAILSGILTMIALYSINIRIMGKANISLVGKETVFSMIDNLINNISSNSKIISVFIIGSLVCLTLIVVLYWFFGTELGYSIRATGNNKVMICALGVNTNRMKIIALAISNSLISLCGALVAQSQGYSDINMGNGAIICGLASIIIGETLFKKDINFMLKLASAVLGSICYRIIITLSLQIGMNPSDLKLFTAITVVLALSLPKFIKKERIFKNVKTR